MKKEERTEMIGVRVTLRDRKAFDRAAEEAGMTVSEFVRAAALSYMAMTLNPYGLRMLAKGIGDVVEEGLRKIKDTAFTKKGFPRLG